MTTIGNLDAQCRGYRELPQGLYIGDALRACAPYDQSSYFARVSPSTPENESLRRELAEAKRALADAQKMLAIQEGAMRVIELALGKK